MLLFHVVLLALFVVQEEARLESERIKAELEALKREREVLALREAKDRAEAEALKERRRAEAAGEASRRARAQWSIGSDHPLPRVPVMGTG